ncbi:hypothetical protein H5T87_11010 [bacterium]|nr:hypothetical protein [bacterium]
MRILGFTSATSGKGKWRLSFKMKVIAPPILSIFPYLYHTNRIGTKPALMPPSLAGQLEEVIKHGSFGRRCYIPILKTGRFTIVPVDPPVLTPVGQPAAGPGRDRAPDRKTLWSLVIKALAWNAPMASAICS